MGNEKQPENKNVVLFRTDVPERETPDLPVDASQPEPQKMFIPPARRLSKADMLRLAEVRAMIDSAIKTRQESTHPHLKLVPRRSNPDHKDSSQE